MLNFEYLNPTKIIFGEGEIAKLTKLVPFQRVLILYGQGSIKTNGVYDQVMNALKGKQVFEVSGVQPNPTLENAQVAIDLIRKEKIEFILAVGGGSVIDCAKFIALAVPYQGEAWDIVTKRGLGLTEATPYGTVLTLPATGSEMNCYFVLSKGDQKLSGGHPLVYPKFSILDPSTTMGLSDRQVGNGIVDAFVHVTEQYLTFNVNSPLQDRFAESILLTLIEEGPKSLKKDPKARANHMWCATMALSGIVGAGVAHDWATHMIGHELTALYGIDHARTLAVVFPSLMWHQRKEKWEKLTQYGKRIWNIDVKTDDDIKHVIEKTTEFFRSMGVPTTLTDYKVGPEIVAKVKGRFEERGFQPLGENQSITLDRVGEILLGAI